MTASLHESTRRITFADAVVEALTEEMRRDPRVFLMGQDVGPFGGIMQTCKGLWQEFGDRRVLDLPVSESAMIGAAIGAALAGLRPVAEISFGEFLPCAMNQLVLQAPNIRYMTGSTATVPAVFRTRLGDGPYRGHPHCYEAWFAHVPGLKVVIPSSPADAKGLMVAAIRDPNPVLFLEHMHLYHAVRDEVPSGEYTVPIGQAVVVRPGGDVTVAATARMVHRAMEAAKALEGRGISVEVLDLRTIAPLDVATILASVRRTGRLVVAHEAWKIGGIGAEVSAQVCESGFDLLRAPVVRVGAAHVPIPSSKVLRDQVLPDTEQLVQAILTVVEGGRSGHGR